MKTAAWTSLGRREAAWKGPDRKGTAPCDSTHEKSWNCYNPREEVPTSPSRSRGLGEAADGLRVARMARLGRDGDGQKPPRTRLPSALYFMQLLPQYANGRNRYLKVAGPGLLCPAPWPPVLRPGPRSLRPPEAPRPGESSAGTPGEWHRCRGDAGGKAGRCGRVVRGRGGSFQSREPRSPSGAKTSRGSDRAVSGPGPDKQPRCRPGPGRAPHPHPISVTLRPERRLEPRPHVSLPLVTSPGALASGPRPGQGGAPMTRPRVLSGGAGGRRAVRPSTSLGTPAPSGPRLAGPAHSTASPALQPTYRSPKGTRLSESLGWPGIPPTG